MAQMRGLPGHDFLRKREEQQRNSDLEMLVRAPHNSAQAMASQIMFLLARHKQNPPGNGAGADNKYKLLCANILKLDVPRHVGDVKHLMERMAQVKLWMAGGRGQSSAIQVARDILTKSLEGPNVRGDWASILLDAYDNLAWIASSNLASYKNLKPPVDEKLRPAWSQAIGEIIEQVLYKNADAIREHHDGDSHNRLGIVSALWQADECQWVADASTWDNIQIIEQERLLEMHKQIVEKFIAFQKRNQLSREADNVREVGNLEAGSSRVNVKSNAPKI